MHTRPRARPAALGLVLMALVASLFFSVGSPSPAGARASARLPFPSKLTVTGGSIKVFEDDVLSRNDQTCTATPARKTVEDWDGSLDIASPAAYYELRCGGEVRAEIRLHHNLYKDANLKNHVTVTMNVKLYEGTSSSTTDLDGQASHSIEIPLNGSGWIRIKVVNGESRSDDYVDTTLNFSHAW